MRNHHPHGADHHPHGPHHGHGADHRPPGPRHHHGDHHPRWIASDVQDSTTPSAFGETLTLLGDLLQKHLTIQFGGTTITLREDARSEIVYERTPHGTRKIRLEIEWEESHGTTPDSSGQVPTFGPPTNPQDRNES